MKKISLIMLIILMLNSISFVSFGSVSESGSILIGNNSTSVSAKSYTDINTNWTPDESVDYALIDVNYQGYIEYSLNFAVSGRYKVTIQNQLATTDTSGEILLDGVSVRTFSISSSDDKQATDAGYVNVSSGVHTLRFVTAKGIKTKIYLYSLDFEYSGIMTEYNISGDDYTAISGAVTDNKPSIGMGVNSTAEYIFTPEVVGTYTIYATVAAEPDKTTTITASVDGVDVGSGTFTGEGWANPVVWEEIPVASVELTSREISLRMKVGENALRLKSIRIDVEVASAELVEAKFLAAMKQAQTATEVQGILKEYNSSLSIPYDDYLNEIFYRKIVDEELTKLSFDSLEETDALFLTLYNEEKANPLVTVTQNGENVTKLQNGEFTVTIADRFMEELKAIAAIYTDDGMTLIDSETIDIEPYESATVTGLSATDEGKLLKIFFLKDTETLRPVELPLIQSRIYVATDGDDTGSGDIDSPLMTINKAIEKVSEINTIHQRDIVIYLAGGEYVIEDTIELDESFSGRDDCGVHFKSLTANNPAVISGGYDVKDWSDDDGDGIYTAKLPDTITDVRQLYIDGYPAQRARSEEYIFAGADWDDPETTDYAQDGFEIDSSLIPEFSKPRDMEIVYPIKWTLQRLPVKNIEYLENTAVVKMDQPYYSTAYTMVDNDSGIAPIAYNKVYFENDIKLLDKQGEFYFDKDKGEISYKPLNGQIMKDVRCVIAKTEGLIHAAGSSVSNKIKNIFFENIEFCHGGYYTEVNESGTVSAQAENLVDPSDGLDKSPSSGGNGRALHAQIEFINADNIIFKNCKISSMGSTALRFGRGVTDSSVTGCVMTDIGGSAVSISTFDAWNLLYTDGFKIAENINIKNNVISRTGTDFMFAPAVSVYYAKNVDIVHNTMTDTPYSAISLGWGWSSDSPKTLGCGEYNVLYNRIDNVSKALRDGGHIYNLGYSSGTKIIGNYLSESPDAGGVYLDSGASNITVKNNVFEGCKNDSIAYGRSEDVVNNVADDNWSDSPQKLTTESSWTGSGCSFTSPQLITDGQWPSEAQNVINNSGVTQEWVINTECLILPEWYTLDFFEHLNHEKIPDGVLKIDLSDYKAYRLNNTSRNAPSAEESINRLMTVSNFAYRDALLYQVTAPAAGQYTLELHYNIETTNATSEFNTSLAFNKALIEKMTDPYVQTFFPDSSGICTNYDITFVSNDYSRGNKFVFCDDIGNPQVFTLNEGVNEIYIANRGNQPVKLIDLRFIPVSTDK